MEKINELNELGKVEYKIVELDKKYKIRKWKAREKREFLNTIKNGESLDTLQGVLVYNCIEGEAAFNPDEFKYMMSQIRQYSIGNTVDLEFYCKCCKNKFLKNIEIDKLIKPIKSNKKEIKSKNYNIIIGEIKNPNYYKSITEDINYISYTKEVDFYLRIVSINDNDCMSLDEIIDLFDNMDIDEFDNIFNQWEDIKFKIDDKYNVECSSCNDSVVYSFDEIPGFFPPSWFR